MAEAVNGILLVDKAPGWTSHDAVAKLRGVTGVRRIGHSGTLDPMATGLLVVFVGRATRAVEFAEAHEKSYTASLRLGVTTDTLDVTGTVLAETEQTVSREELETALARFRGETEQTPPMYSAIKRDGKKLYEIARAGGEVERAPRRVVISSLECLGRDGDDWRLAIKCSKGTYIRSLCADIGAALGCGGCMSALRRTGAGAFSVESAHSVAQLERDGAEKYLLPVDTLFAGRPAIALDAAGERRVRVGAEISIDAPDGEYRVYSGGGEFLALCRAQSGALKTIKSFFEV